MTGEAQGFPRAARLTEAADYSRVFKRSRKRSSDRWLTLLAAENSQGRPRLGLAVSRKAAKSAVARNRIKRLVRESFRLHQQQLPALDIVVVARPGIAGVESKVLRQALERHWKRISGPCAKSSSSS